MSPGEKLDLIIRQNELILAYLNLNLKMDVKMADTLDDVVHDMENFTTIEEGTNALVDHAISLLDEIGAKLKEAGDDPAKLAALRASIAKNGQALEEKKAAVAAAIQRNTPFDPSGNQ